MTKETIKKLEIVCQAVIKFANSSANCGICGGDTERHDEGCPVPIATEAMKAVKKENKK